MGYIRYTNIYIYNIYKIYYIGYIRYTKHTVISRYEFCHKLIGTLKFFKYIFKTSLQSSEISKCFPSEKKIVGF